MSPITLSIRPHCSPRTGNRRRRPPPATPIIQTGDPANGTVHTGIIPGVNDTIIECYSTLNEAEAAALTFARQKNCLFAPSTIRGDAR